MASGKRFILASSREHRCGLSHSRDTDPLDCSASVPPTCQAGRTLPFPQVPRDLADSIPAGEPPDCLQP